MLHNRFITNYFRLPVIRKTVGILDRYRKGIVKHIDFNGELHTVWIQFKNYSKAYRAFPY